MENNQLANTSNNFVGSFNNFMTLEELEKRRMEAQNKKTPEQHKGQLPMGGKMTTYVKSKYMIDELMKYCKEQFNVRFVEIKDVSLPTSEKPEHWVRVAVEIFDRSSGNSTIGIGASRVRTNTEGVIINYRHDCTAAETYAIKDAAKNFGIAADIYGRDIEAFSEELQNILNSFLPELKKAFGKDDYDRFLNKIEVIGNAQEDKILELIKSVKSSPKWPKEQK